MKIWVSLAAVFAAQEVLSTVAVLTIARAHHYPALLIHVLWFAVAFGETAAIYFLGKWFEYTFSDKWIGRLISKFRTHFERAVGIYGEKVAVLVFAILFSPGLAALFGAILEIPFYICLPLVMLADLFWYVYVWVVTLGLAKFSSNIALFLGGLLLIVFLSFMATYRIRRNLRS